MTVLPRICPETDSPDGLKYMLLILSNKRDIPRKAALSLLFDAPYMKFS